MKEIKEFYNESSDFLNSLLTRELKVSEKLSGTKFRVLKQNNELFFYGRDKREPLDLIDRTISNLYEKPIKFIEKLKDKLPNNTYFYFEYFYNSKPLFIKYNKMPKNGLVLTHLVCLNADGSNRIDNSTDTLRAWSKSLKVDIPKTYFEGFLTQDQIILINSYLLSDKIDEFTKYFIKTFSPSIRKTTLNDNTKDDIEGFIIEFVSDKLSTKIINPSYKDLQEASKTKTANDDIGLLIYEFNNWLSTKDVLKEISAEGKTIDTRYIDFMSKLVTYFIEDNPILIKDIKFKKPVFALYNDFKFNTNFITNESVKSFMLSNPQYLDIYKIVLSTYRKERKKETAIIDSNLKNHINIYIKLIKVKCKNIKDESYCTFTEWRKFKK